MNRAEFIKRNITNTTNDISQAKAQLIVDSHKPQVSKSLLTFIELCKTKLLRYDMGILNEGEEFHLDNINS